MAVHRLHRVSFVVLVCALGCACTVENPNFGMDGADVDDGSAGADLMTKTDIKKCKPNAFLGCKSGAVLLRCNSAGTGTRSESCTYGCNAKAKRCNQCSPGWPPKCVGDTLYTCTPDGKIKVVNCPDDCEEGKCEGKCTKKTYYRDADKDGYGDPKKKTSACDKPDGYATNGADCNDQNSSVRPGQKTFFNKPVPGTKGFDYNCDGKSEPRYPQKAKCKKQGSKCVGSGWGIFIPQCGQMGMWLECVKHDHGPNGCGEKIGGRSQPCR